MRKEKQKGKQKVFSENQEEKQKVSSGSKWRPKSTLEKVSTYKNVGSPKTMMSSTPTAVVDQNSQDAVWFPLLLKMACLFRVRHQLLYLMVMIRLRKKLPAHKSKRKRVLKEEFMSVMI